MKEISALEHVKIKGLMQIAPFVDDPEDNRKYLPCDEAIILLTSTTKTSIM